MPTRREGDSDTAVRQVVDHGPLFRNSNGIVEGNHDAAGPDLNALRDRCDRRARDGGIGIKTAESMEVSFRSPDRREAVLIGKLRSFEQQPVFARGTAGFVSCEVEKAEVHLPRFYFRIDFVFRAGDSQGFGLKHDFETARKRPQ